jgi:hypothetical protein
MRVVCLDMMETRREAMAERMSKWFDIANDAQIKYSADGCYLMNCRRECHLYLSERAAVAGRPPSAGSAVRLTSRTRGPSTGFQL